MFIYLITNKVTSQHKLGHGDENVCLNIHRPKKQKQKKKTNGGPPPYPPFLNTSQDPLHHQPHY